jgi:hypothetical protein
MPDKPLLLLLFCSLFSLLAFLGLVDQTFNQISFGGMSEEYIDADSMTVSLSAPPVILSAAKSEGRFGTFR